MNLRRIYEYALQREHEGRNFFQHNAQRMSHEAAVGIFRKLQAEEEKHIAFVEGLLRGLGSENIAPQARDDSLTAEGFFAQRADTEMLEQTVIESMVPDVTILRMAYLIERDLAEFYEMAASEAEGEAREALGALSRWERGHENLFKELHDRVYEQYMKMPWGG